MKRVTILHPWLPQYRVPFFAALVDRMATQGVEITVAHGAPPSDVRDRQDSRRVDWATEVPSHRIPGSASLVWQSLDGLGAGRDLLILEQALRNLELYPWLVAGLVRRPRVALWGHGRTYTKQHSAAERRAKTLLTNRAHWFFAYTEGGAEFVRAQGFPQQRITVVQNALDTQSLRRDMSGVSEEDWKSTRLRLGLPDRYALYLGGLDGSKRLDLLVSACDRVADQVDDFRLVVAGAGPLAAQMRAWSSQRPWLVPVGPVFGKDKATVASGAVALVNPGRVGLVAVDSFAMGLPLVTCRWPYHAPEFEYLDNNVNAIITEDGEMELAQGVVRVWTDALLRQRLSSHAWHDGERYTLAAMVDRFAEGVHRALAA